MIARFCLLLLTTEDELLLGLDASAALSLDLEKPLSSPTKYVLSTGDLQIKVFPKQGYSLSFCCAIVLHSNRLSLFNVTTGPKVTALAADPPSVTYTAKEHKCAYFGGSLLGPIRLGLKGLNNKPIKYVEFTGRQAE